MKDKNILALSLVLNVVLFAAVACLVKERAIDREIRAGIAAPASIPFVAPQLPLAPRNLSHSALTLFPLR